MIRLVQHHDSEALYALIERNRERLRPWMPWVDGHCSVADTHKFITTSLLGYTGMSKMDCLIIIDDRPIGVVCLNWINVEHRTASLGYWIDGDMTGRGLVTEACREVLDLVFCRMRLQRLEVRISPRNAASLKVPVRLGFRHEGTLRGAEWLHDHFEDNELFAILRDEYPAAAARACPAIQEPMTMHAATRIWLPVYGRPVGSLRIAIISGGPSRHRLQLPVSGVDRYIAVNRAVDRLIDVPPERRAWILIDDPAAWDAPQPPPMTEIWTTAPHLAVTTARYPDYVVREIPIHRHLQRQPHDGVRDGATFQGWLAAPCAVHMAYSLGGRDIGIFAADWQGTYDDDHWALERRLMGEAAMLIRARGGRLSRWLADQRQDLAAEAETAARTAGTIRPG